jgi:hypothetical protein
MLNDDASGMAIRAPRVLAPPSTATRVSARAHVGRPAPFHFRSPGWCAGLGPRSRRVSSVRRPADRGRDRTSAAGDGEGGEGGGDVVRG